ncbi:MAG: UDP-N-acetylmuramoyl-tripeptide--D-alanyl-D-alanine ligase [bacterium]
MKLDPAELQNISFLQLRNFEKLLGKTITGVSTDSRTIRENEVFFALRGETFDGHKFLAEAFANGCIAAVIERSTNIEAVKTMPLVIVENTTLAYGELARNYRLKYSIPVLAIGGSNGKTTTKEMITKVLHTRYNVLSTQGNLNNQIGVPQTLFNLEKRHDIAVVEIGTNHPGEIRYLCNMLEPTHGLVTNIGREHLEFFQTVGGVAKEEGELFKNLSSRTGSIAFVNADDKNVLAKSKKVKTKVSYSFRSKKASVSGKILESNESGCVKMTFAAKSAKRGVTVQLPIPGEHNAMNALAAAAVALTFKVPAASIKSALEKFTPASKRMETVLVNGITIYNDTYNANPDSMIAALRTLDAARVDGNKIAVLADMKELGKSSSAEHARVGKALTGLKIDYLLTFGDEAKAIHDKAKIVQKTHFETKGQLAEFLAELAGPGDAILVKGSRGMKMEEVVASLHGRWTDTATA